MSLKALARRTGQDDAVADYVLRDINAYYYWPRFFALRALGAHARGQVVARLVARLDSSWRDPMPLQLLREFVAARADAGETPTPDELSGEIKSLDLSAAQAADLNLTLGELGDALTPALRQEAERWRGERSAYEFAKTLGRVWERGAPGLAAGEGGGEVFVLDSVAARVAELEAAVKREPARSVLLVGDSGTGKTALVRALAERLGRDGWVVFEAGAADVLAGQTYIGQLEERVQSIVRQLGGRRVLWVVPNFQETLWAGRHRYSPVGVLDLLLPSIESGAVRVAAQPDEPAGREPGALVRQAEQALAATPAPQAVVRRYREGPSPLVRDSARGWRTGHLERVLDGDFDIVV